VYITHTQVNSRASCIRTRFETSVCVSVIKTLLRISGRRTRRLCFALDSHHPPQQRRAGAHYSNGSGKSKTRLLAEERDVVDRVQFLRYGKYYYYYDGCRDNDALRAPGRVSNRRRSIRAKKNKAGPGLNRSRSIARFAGRLDAFGKPYVANRRRSPGYDDFAPQTRSPTPMTSVRIENRGRRRNPFECHH